MDFDERISRSRAEANSQEERKLWLEEQEDRLFRELDVLASEAVAALRRAEVPEDVVYLKHHGTYKSAGGVPFGRPEPMFNWPQKRNYYVEGGPTTMGWVFGFPKVALLADGTILEPHQVPIGRRYRPHDWRNGIKVSFGQCVCDWNSPVVMCDDDRHRRLPHLQVRPGYHPDHGDDGYCTRTSIAETLENGVSSIATRSAREDRR